MSSVLRPIIINNSRDSVYTINNRAREEIERKIEEYESVINPILENYEESNNQVNAHENRRVNNDSINDEYRQYQDVINPLIINRTNNSSESRSNTTSESRSNTTSESRSNTTSESRTNNSSESRSNTTSESYSRDSLVLDTESSLETSYELFESTDEDNTLVLDPDEEDNIVNSSDNDSLIRCEKEFNSAVTKFLEESLCSEESDSDVQDCAICLSRVSNIMRDNDVYIEYDECGHRVHIDCMKKWRSHRELSCNFKKMRFLKCELCQIPRSFTIVKSLVEVKRSNRMRKMCCIV